MWKRISFILIAVILCGTASVAQETYTVRDGDALSKIAQKYKVEEDSIKKWNNLTGDKIKIGQELTVSQKKAEVVDKEKEQPKQEIKQEESATNIGAAAGRREATKKGPAKSKAEGRKEKTTDKSSNSPLWWLWLLFGLGGGILVWEKLLRVKILPFFNRKETQDNQDYIEQLQHDKKELKSKIEELNKKIGTLEKQNKEFLEENIEMGRKIEGFQYRPKQSYIADVHKPQRIAGQACNDNPKPSVVVTAPDRNDEPQTSASTLYADAIINGSLNRVKETPNEDTIFELHLQNAHTATFTIYQSAYQRIVANPSFLEGCDKQVLNNEHKVEIASKGTTQRDADGKWKIIHKLNVIIK
jgi:LysM repeat protein